MKPLQHFLDHDIEQVKNSQTSYQKARTDTLQIAEKFLQVTLTVMLADGHL